jgi:hypothetical protein
VLSPAFAGEITEAMFVPKMLRCDTLPEDPRGASSGGSISEVLQGQKAEDLSQPGVLR